MGLDLPLDVRGTAAGDGSGGLEGNLTYTRATGFGQTAATARGTFTGTSLSGPLLWVTPAATSAATALRSIHRTAARPSP